MSYHNYDSELTHHLQMFPFSCSQLLDTFFSIIFFISRDLGDIFTILATIIVWSEKGRYKNLKISTQNVNEKILTMK